MKRVHSVCVQKKTNFHSNRKETAYVRNYFYTSFSYTQTLILIGWAIWS